MNLKISNTSITKSGRLVVDRHVPFRFRVDLPNFSPKCRWFIKNKYRNDFVEFGITKETGELAWFVLIDVRVAKFSTDKDAYEAVNILTCLPKFQKISCDYKEEYVDNMELIMCDTKFMIFFRKDLTPNRTMRCDRFGISDINGEIISVSFHDLTNEEKELLLERFKISK